MLLMGLKETVHLGVLHFLLSMYRCIILVLIFATPVLEKRMACSDSGSSSSTLTAAEAVLVAVNQKSSVIN